MLWAQMSSWLVWTTLPQKNPNCTVFVKLDYRAVSSPIAQMGLLRPPGEGELQTAMNQRGSWEAARPCRLSLEATAYISSSHRCRGKCGRQVGGHHQEDPPLCLQVSHIPLLASLGPHNPLPTLDRSPKSSRPTTELDFLPQVCTHVT